ncbi:MAG: hypothetical protein K1X57_07415 [Gemmataceae bacterium]|nr:hypothetical protein [Gemmataceae bacterium]
MRRRRQLFLFLVCVSALAGTVGSGLWFGVRHEPAFYQRAGLPKGPDRQRLAQEFLRRSSDVYNLVANGQPWTLTIAQEQLNAYLQDENTSSSGLFTYPENVTDPRVEFESDRIRIGFRYGSGTASAIVSVDLRTWLLAKESNAIALELCGLSVGGVPLGSHALMEYVTEAAREWNADVTWYRHNSHPVAIIRLQANQSRPTLQLRQFEMTAGQATLTGKPTGDNAPASSDGTGN